MSGKVYFIGAGPGDPELLTLRAAKILGTAEVVLHDALVPREILDLIAQDATLRSVGKRCGETSITQEQIHALLVAHARAGRLVVRLQGGDPLIFGRAGEEIAALREAGVAFEIVPGVTAASAAAAALQIALTDRRVASKLVFVSAHRRAEMSDSGHDWKSLAAPDATLAVYMPGGHYGSIARELIEAGLPVDTPCAVISQASRKEQTSRRLNLAALADATELPAPALLLVGRVAENAAAGELAAECLEVADVRR